MSAAAYATAGWTTDRMPDLAGKTGVWANNNWFAAPLFATYEICGWMP